MRAILRAPGGNLCINMATREVANKLGRPRKSRKSRIRCDESEKCLSVKKRRKMDSDYVEKWDAAALRVK